MKLDKILSKNFSGGDFVHLINSARHQNALNYALKKIKESPLSEFVTAVYLFGSCARNEEQWDSDVDLLLELSNNFHDHPELRIPLRLLKSEVSSDEISEPETDLKIVVGPDWRSSNMLFYKEIQSEGVMVWY